MHEMRHVTNIIKPKIHLGSEACKKDAEIKRNMRSDNYNRANNVIFDFNGENLNKGHQFKQQSMLTNK